ncbi:MAG: diguanylate cyclase (GGDEF)-like protein [Desulforhopalus sp.]|jgi:diguanylate cyclase (GGDEF)-like protein
MKGSLFRKQSRWAILTVNCCILLIVVLLQLQYQLHERKKDFVYTINNVIRKDISDKLSTTKGLLTSLVSYYQSSHDRSPSAFALISGDLLKNYPFLTAIGYAKIVSGDERAQFEESMVDLGLYDFRIRKFDTESKAFVPERIQKQYAPIIRIEPSNYKLTRYYGYDLLNSIFFHSHVSSAIASSQIIPVYNVLESVDLESYFFLKATYFGELIPGTEVDRLEKANGLYIVNVDINILLQPIREQYTGWTIDVSEEPQLKLVSLTLLEKNNLFELNYRKPIDEIENISLHIQRPLHLVDLDLFMLFVAIASVIALQAMALLLWRKDILVRRELNYQARHDDLTGLPNRMLLRDQLRGTLEQLQGKSEGKDSIAIVFIDLDHFKEVNDSYGHQFGDEVLIEIASRFQATLRKTDTICRLGGDEFIVLLNTVGDNELIITTIERIMDCMKEPVTYDSRKVYLSASFGVATYPKDGSRVSDLLKNADAAMYKAKQNGRNRYCFYNIEMTERAIERLTLESKLRHAIENDGFEVYYQPQIDGRTGEIIGLEALVRWFDGEELISPEKFIPLAEDTGLIVPMDILIMQKAIAQLGRWSKMGLQPGRLALNLSPRQMQHVDFIDILEENLKSNGCRPEWIELEITEGHIMSDPEAAIIFLTKLAEKDIRLAIDDFGTGYSSLSYLKKLPLNKLKIDRSFVWDLPHDEEDVSITTTIIALATNLNLEILAEGVETEEQRTCLVELGCFNLQGFLYSPARPAKEIEAFLRSKPFEVALKN